MGGAVANNALASPCRTKSPIQSQCRTNFAINAPNEKPNRKFRVSRFDARMGGHQMRRERRATCEDAETITYTFHFQISSNGGRQACSVKVQAPNIHDATTFFRQNWPMIESMAREGLADRTGDGRTIRLSVPDNGVALTLARSIGGDAPTTS